MSIRTIAWVAALSLSALPAFAEHHEKSSDHDKAGTSATDKDAGNAVSPDKKTATEKVGDSVPQMKTDQAPAKDSTAPGKETYTDEVGKSVPDMTAPKESAE